jgi:hypothetical protein
VNGYPTQVIVFYVIGLYVTVTAVVIAVLVGITEGVVVPLLRRRHNRRTQ